MAIDIKTLIGAAAPIGYTGSQGPIGYTGSIGSIGYTGSLGYTGSEGAGFTGSQGAIGYTGSAGSIGTVTLNDLNDINITSPEDGQSLTYNSSSGEWENSAIDAGAGKAFVMTLLFG